MTNIEKYIPEKMNRGTGQSMKGSVEDIDREYLYILGDAFLQCQHFEKSLLIFEFLTDQFPGDFHAEKCRSYAFLMLERFEEALELIQKLQQNRDKIDELSYATLSLIKARALLKLDRLDEARRAMEDYIEIKKIYKQENAEQI